MIFGLRAKPNYPEVLGLSKTVGIRTILGRSVLREGIAIGVIRFAVPKVRPFSDKQIASP